MNMYTLLKCLCSSSLQARAEDSFVYKFPPILKDLCVRNFTVTVSQQHPTTKRMHYDRERDQCVVRPQDAVVVLTASGL